MSTNAKLPDEYQIQEIFERLQRSAFRRRFQLKGRELDYLQDKGLDTILAHGKDFIRARLAPANPENDGKQTPYRNHPIFVSQHATATCCRGCLEKWHGIPKGRALSESEQEYILTVLQLWMERYLQGNPTSGSLTIDQ